MTLLTSTNVVWHHATVDRARREAQNGYRGIVIWFAGLSGFGKSILAKAAQCIVEVAGEAVEDVDGVRLRYNNPDF